MKIMSFVLTSVVLAPLGWAIGGLLGGTVFASILGGLFGLLMAWVLRRPLSWLFDLLSHLP
jgi:ABC-type sulfate transport system permease component